MSNLQNGPDSIRPLRRFRGNLIPEAPALFGELWGGVEPGPAGVLLVNGLGGVLDRPLRETARHLASVGLSALAIDRPGFGESGGEPRDELNPEEDVRVFAQALKWLAARTRGPLGAWGTSFGAVEALLLAEADARVRAVVAQALPPRVSRNLEVQAELERVVALDLEGRAAGLRPRSLPLVSDSPKTLCAIPGADAWRHLTEVAPAGWSNRITLRSLLLCSRIDSGETLRRASVPVCVVGVRGDARALSEGELPETAERVYFDGGHFELYGRLLPRAAETAAHFFTRRLRNEE